MMNRLFFILLFFLGVQFNVFAQNVIKHKVVNGDGFYGIAKKYGVTENDIYQWNPKAKGKVLQPNDILIIQKTKLLQGISSDFHRVSSGESFFSIAKKYNTTLAELKSLNPEIDPNRLQIGMKVKLSKSNFSSDNILEATSSTNDVIHQVKKGETLHSISKNYGLTVNDLQKLNPSSNTKLFIGQQLLIKKGENEVVKMETEVVKMMETSSEDDHIEEDDDSGDLKHIVTKGETLYALAKKYKVKVATLKSLNKQLGENLPIGHVLLIKRGEIRPKKEPETIENEEQLEEITPLSSEKLSIAEQLIMKSSAHIGTRYRSGGTTPSGFDCSGLMIYTFNDLDLKLPRSSSEQSNIGKNIKKSQAQKGDLIFFSTNGRGTINHVGMITEIIDDEIKFIHSSVRNGVIISSTNEAYYAKRFKKIKRVLE